MSGIFCILEKYQASFMVVFTAVLALATIYLWRATQQLWITTRDMLEVTKASLEEARKSSWGTIILEANRDLFFNDRMYRVRKAIDDKKPILSAKGGKCSEQDVEDYIGYFEMLYGMITSRIIDATIVSDNFGGYVEQAYINKEIRDYIDDLRRELNSEELYEGFYKWGKGELPNSKNL
jgi:hypothetical protein